jgi:hypothetical protein
MAAFARTISRAFPVASVQFQILKQLAMFCGAALVVWLPTATYGLDLSPGLF